MSATRGQTAKQTPKVWCFVIGFQLAPHVVFLLNSAYSIREASSGAAGLQWWDMIGFAPPGEGKAHVFLNLVGQSVSAEMAATALSIAAPVIAAMKEPMTYFKTRGTN